MSAQAQLRQAQINLDYTEIRAPVGGKIGQTRFTIGNVVSPSSGPLRYDRQPGPDVYGVPDRHARLARDREPLRGPRRRQRDRCEAASAGR